MGLMVGVGYGKLGEGEKLRVQVERKRGESRG